MPTAKTGFQIFNLHPKKHRIKKKKDFFGGCIFAKILLSAVARSRNNGIKKSNVFKFHIEKYIGNSTCIKNIK